MATLDSDHVTEMASSPVSPLKKKRKGHKRVREDDVVRETPRNHKRIKSEHAPGTESSQVEPPSPIPTEGSIKKKRRSKHLDDTPAESSKTTDSPAQSDRKRKRKDKSKDTSTISVSLATDAGAEHLSSQADGLEAKKVKSERRHKTRRKGEVQDAMDGHPLGTPVPDADDSTRKKSARVDPDLSQDLSQAPVDRNVEWPEEAAFPFFDQLVSLYVPLYPVGFDKPITKVASQHLDPLLNNYSPLLKGILLAYSDVQLSDVPKRASGRCRPTDETPALLECVGEYAVAFGWLTFKASLFVPTRGSWMEGSVNLQSEGYCGFLCWDKFNASVEAKRLPRGWRWVDKDSAHEDGPGEAEIDGEDRTVEHVHETGYWLDAHGRTVTGKQRFRIKGFTCGLADEYGYLSIEGTFLDDDAERALASQEREMEQRRRAKQNPGGLLRPQSRNLPEFSMTTFGREAQEGAEQRYAGADPEVS